MRLARMMFVVGKGGVGKTTVSAILAQRLSSLGQRVLFVGLGQPTIEPAKRLLPRTVAAIAIEGEAALAEYLGLALASRRIQKRILSSELYRRFVAVAPGLRELMALGKVCDEERRVDADGTVWDAVVIDGPPTGHALEYFVMARSAVETFGQGLVTWEARRMLAALQDPLRARVYPVTTLEEMAVHEMEQLVREIRRLEMSIGSLFVNRVRACPFPPERLTAAHAESEAARAALGCARVEASWADLHRQRLARLRASSPSIVALPELGCRTFGREQIERLGSEVTL